jgi:PAS domain S-box-containing protein
MGQVLPSLETPFRIIAETASDAIITIDEDSTIVSVNPAAERIFGYSIPEMLGQPMTMLMPEHLRHLHKAGLRRFMQTGQRHIKWDSIEFPGLHKDGRTINLEISFGEFVAEGRRLFTGIVRDITQRKHEQRLKSAYTAAVRILAENPSSESVLRETLCAICNALEWKLGILWNVDKAHEELQFTASSTDHEALSGFVDSSRAIRYTKGVGLPGSVWSTKQPVLVRRISDETNFTRKAAASQFGLISGAAFPIIARQEVIAVMEFFSTEIQQPDQELLDTFMTIGHQMGQYMERSRVEESLVQSIAREKVARREAEAANRMKDEFLTLLSHELRTPLTSVYGWVQLLQDRPADPQTTAKALAVIDRNVRVQVQLIDDLLNISRIITGKLQIQREQVDPLVIVSAAVEMIRPSADAKQITLTFEAYSQMPHVSVDPKRLQQIVWNILSNAVKFTPSGGSIIVTARWSPTELRIVVADSGEGISPDFLPHVFDRFSQADTSKTRRYSGLGLGLALVRQLVELHGGTVRAESAGIGQGSTFTISLPA